MSFDEISKYYQLYSGNLDAKAIREVLGLYGIDYQNKVSELKMVKQYRNILAHGEKTFEEVGRELTIEQLQVIFSRAFNFMEDVVNRIEDFLDHKNYLVLPTQVSENDEEGENIMFDY